MAVDRTLGDLSPNLLVIHVSSLVNRDTVLATVGRAAVHFNNSHSVSIRSHHGGLGHVTLAEDTTYLTTGEVSLHSVNESIVLGLDLRSIRSASREATFLAQIVLFFSNSNKSNTTSVHEVLIGISQQSDRWSAEALATLLLLSNFYYFSHLNE